MCVCVCVLVCVCVYVRVFALILNIFHVKQIYILWYVLLHYLPKILENRNRPFVVLLLDHLNQWALPTLPLLREFHPTMMTGPI